MFPRLIFNFLREEEGQSLIQYCVLLCWVTLASTAVINGLTSAEKGIWQVTNSQLTAANTSAS